MNFISGSIRSKIISIIHLYSKKLGIDLDYYIKNSLWNTSNLAITILFGAILSIFLARFTTKEVFGYYNLILSIITIISLISLPGLNISVMKSASRGKDGVYVKSVKLSFIWSLIGIPLLLLIGFYYYFFENNFIVGTALMIASIIFPFFFAPNNWQHLLIGKKIFKLYSKLNILKTLISTISIIMAIIMGKGSLIPIIIAYMISNALFNIYYYYWCKKLLTNNAEEKGWKNTGYRLTFIEFTLYAYNNIDKIIIGILLGPTQLAIYVIAVTLVNIVISSFSQLFIILSPKIMEMGKDVINSYLKRFMPKFIILNIFFLIIFVYILPYILTALYSAKYTQSIYYAQIYSLIIPLSLIMNITNNVLVSTNKEKIFLNIRFIGTIILFSLYLILIPLIGITGAIISSIIYYIVIDILQYFYSIKSLKL